MVAFSGDHLRGCTTRASAGRLEQLTVFVGVGETEIDDLDLLLVIEQEVLRLKVSVDNVQLVQVIDP